MHLNAAIIVRNVSRRILAIHEVQTKPRFAQGTCARARNLRNQQCERRIFIFDIGEQQRSEDYTNCSSWWLDEIGSQTFGTGSRGAGSRTAGRHRGRDFAPAKSSDEQSRTCACIQVIIFNLILQTNENLICVIN